MMALTVEVSFNEAVFNQHVTKGVRASYLIPLPTSVAGMFGAMLGIPRSEMSRFIEDKMFGAALIDFKGISKEYIQGVKVKSDKVEYPSPQYQTLVLMPTYLIAVAGDETVISKISDRLGRGWVYLPYGGYNDHPATWVEVKGVSDVVDSTEVYGYAPVEDVEDVKLEGEGHISRDQVMYRGVFTDFLFSYRARIILKRPYPSADGVALYPIKGFFNYLERVGVGRR